MYRSLYVENHKSYLQTKLHQLSAHVRVNDDSIQDLIYEFLLTHYMVI